MFLQFSGGGGGGGGVTKIQILLCLSDHILHMGDGSVTIFQLGQH